MLPMGLQVGKTVVQKWTGMTIDVVGPGECRACSAHTVAMKERLWRVGITQAFNPKCSRPVLSEFTVQWRWIFGQQDNRFLMH